MTDLAPSDSTSNATNNRHMSLACRLAKMLAQSDEAILKEVESIISRPLPKPSEQEPTTVIDRGTMPETSTTTTPTLPINPDTHGLLEEDDSSEAGDSLSESGPESSHSDTISESPGAPEDAEDEQPNLSASELSQLSEIPYSLIDANDVVLSKEEERDKRVKLALSILGAIPSNGRGVSNTYVPIERKSGSHHDDDESDDDENDDENDSDMLSVGSDHVPIPDVESDAEGETGNSSSSSEDSQATGSYSDADSDQGNISSDNGGTKTIVPSKKTSSSSSQPPPPAPPPTTTTGNLQRCSNCFKQLDNSAAEIAPFRGEKRSLCVSCSQASRHDRDKYVSAHSTGFESLNAELLATGQRHCKNCARIAPIDEFQRGGRQVFIRCQVCRDGWRAKKERQRADAEKSLDGTRERYCEKGHARPLADFEDGNGVVVYKYCKECRDRRNKQSKARRARQGQDQDQGQEGIPSVPQGTWSLPLPLLNHSPALGSGGKALFAPRPKGTWSWPFGSPPLNPVLGSSGEALLSPRSKGPDSTVLSDSAAEDTNAKKVATTPKTSGSKKRRRCLSSASKTPSSPDRAKKSKRSDGGGGGEKTPSSLRGTAGGATTTAAFDSFSKSARMTLRGGGVGSSRGSSPPQYHHEFVLPIRTRSKLADIAPLPASAPESTSTKTTTTTTYGGVEEGEGKSNIGDQPSTTATGEEEVQQEQQQHIPEREPTTYEETTTAERNLASEYHSGKLTVSKLLDTYGGRSGPLDHDALLERVQLVLIMWCEIHHPRPMGEALRAYWEVLRYAPLHKGEGYGKAEGEYHPDDFPGKLVRADELLRRVPLMGSITRGLRVLAFRRVMFDRAAAAAIDVVVAVAQQQQTEGARGGEKGKGKQK
ncbi:hypothetical protein UCREL1_5800 [Eutypa lata UCREL1]|uniref:Uncharacterized protein n=1 Tax=Eutypa lata (strain UCR-EL1) TaxID=1287681 RepID=M7SRU2_EUTLA|nr:hypothetical protein UCREL1_5800 [Eutypa lata UCREL1]